MFAAGRIATVEQDHVGIFGAQLVECGPDEVFILIGGTRCERDARGSGQHRFGFRTALGGTEVAAVERHSAIDDRF